MTQPTETNQESRIPNVCSIVEYGMDSFEKVPATWRVEGWLCELPPLVDLDCGTPGSKTRQQIANTVIMKIRRENPPDPSEKRLRWCLREDATHLALSGICGAVAPVEACSVIRMVDWEDSVIAEYRAYAITLGEKGERV